MEINSSYEVDSYKKINVIFILIIMFIFFYCFLTAYFSFGITSSCEGMPLIYCKSRGLTRAFSQILRFNFQEATDFNPYGLKIFFFFLLQLLSRIFINIKINLQNFKKIVFVDIFISVLFFLFSFYNLILT